MTHTISDKAREDEKKFLSRWKKVKKRESRNFWDKTADPKHAPLPDQSTLKAPNQS